MKFVLPLEIYISSRKKFILNLNNYRNSHYHVLNNAKKAYKEYLIDQLHQEKIETPVRLKYTLYRGNNRDCDTNNILSIVDKFFCDALQEYGCIKDDNYKHIIETIFTFGGIEKGKGRVEVETY